MRGPGKVVGKKQGVGAFFGATGAWVADLLRLIPEQVHAMTIAAMILGVADLVTGVTLAAARGKLSSREARIKTLSKAAQFFGLVALGAAIAVVTRNWLWYAGAWAAVVGIEGLSILENLSGLETTGAKLGPARPFLRSLGRFFATTGETDLPQCKEEKAEEKTHDGREAGS